MLHLYAMKRRQHMEPYYVRCDMTSVLTRRTNTKVNWCSPLVKTKFFRCLKETGNMWLFQVWKDDEFNKVMLRKDQPG